MIISGVSNDNNCGFLCRYVLDPRDNDRAELKEIKGVVSQNVVDWFQEIEATASGTRCKSPFYHASINPRPDEKLTHEQFMQSVDLLEKNLKLEDHARIVLQHINDKGREHYHIVWSRLDENNKAVHMSKSYTAHERTARELERIFDHERVQGVHIEREGERPPRAFSNEEMKQAKRKGVNLREVKEQVTEAWKRTETGADFMAELDALGYAIARGDKQGALVLVDEKGGIHGLTRRIDGANAAAVRERMKEIDRAALPNVEQAQEKQLERFEKVETERKEKLSAELKLLKDFRAGATITQIQENKGDRKEKRAADALERWEERQAEKSKEKSAALPGREGEQIINGGLNAAGKVADSLVSMLDGFFDILAGGSPKPPPAPEPRRTQPIKTEADMMRELFELGRDEQNARRARERERDDEGRERER